MIEWMGGKQRRISLNYADHPALLVIECRLIQQERTEMLWINMGAMVCLVLGFANE
jgi:hypothetical protein